MFLYLSSLSFSDQVIHDLRFTALHFQDAEYRVSEPSPQYLHCCLWDSHFRLHPQSTLLLLPDSVRPPCDSRMCLNKPQNAIHLFIYPLQSVSGFERLYLIPKHLGYKTDLL